MLSASCTCTEEVPEEEVQRSSETAAPRAHQRNRFAKYMSHAETRRVFANRSHFTVDSNSV